MSQPYNPPHNVVSVDTPWRIIVVRADPDFERAKRREVYYQFSNGRTFRGDNATTGAYDGK